MRFRFTISRDAVSNAVFPDITTWSQDSLGTSGADEPWDDVGTDTPNITFVGATIIPPTSSQWLYVDYAFVPGWQYKFDITVNRVDNEASSNPRTLALRIKDALNADVFSESHAVDEGTGTYSIEFVANEDCEKFALRFLSGTDRTITIESVEVEITPLSESYVINEPDGWKDCKLKLTRDPVFHSLVEYFEGSFIFYGDNGRVNGGYDILKQWDAEGGPDAAINILIEYTDDDTEFETVFEGQLDMSMADWMLDNKVRIPIIKDSFWATFMGRKDIPVDLTSSTDLDENEIDEPVSEIEISLPSQKIRYNGEYNWLESVTYPADEDDEGFFGMQLDWDENVVDDIKKFDLPRVPIDIGNIFEWAQNLIGNFEAPWDGSYRIQAKLFFSEWVTPGDLWVANASSFELYAQKTNTITKDETLKASKTTVSVGGGQSYAIAELDVVMPLRKGEQVAIYGWRGATFRNYTIFGERRTNWKADVELATQGTIVLSGEQTIDGVMTSGSRVLVRAQGNAEENGIYVSGAGAWTRASDCDTADELINASVYVTSGDMQHDTAWRQVEEDVTIDVTANTWLYATPSDERFAPFPDTVEVENYLIITADTIFKTTQTSGYLIHDAAAAILQRLGLSNS